MSPRSRYLAAGLLAVASVGGPTALVPVASDGDPGVEARVAVTFRDDEIDE